MSRIILARPTAPQLLTIFVIASIFGALAFLYSFFGLFSNERNNIPPFVLNAAGFDIKGRMSHSISFAILASVLIGVIASQIYRIARQNSTRMPSVVTSSGNIEKKLADNDRQNSPLLAEKSSVFYEFLVITLAVYMSHIAYDVFVGLGANFPLLAPFRFNDVFIPQIYALPIEGAAILLVYYWYSINGKSNYSSDSQ
jgi:hypothetical protein